MFVKFVLYNRIFCDIYILYDIYIYIYIYILIKIDDWYSQ